MRVTDVSCRAAGMVAPCFVDLSTGKRIPFERRHNTLSFMSAEAMAAAFGGDQSYIPSRMGIIYGDSPTMPGGTDDIGRYQTWSRLYEDLSGASQGATIDVQVVDFSYAPSLGGDRRASPSGSSDSSGGDADEDNYRNILPTGSNAITFHAISNSQDRGTLFDIDTFKEGSYIYQCLLLGFHDGKYYIIARAPLDTVETGSGGSTSSAYLQKPKGFEVAIDWTVVFH